MQVLLAGRLLGGMVTNGEVVALLTKTSTLLHPVLPQDPEPTLENQMQPRDGRKYNVSLIVIFPFKSQVYEML
jgi:hypothetical protein